MLVNPLQSFHPNQAMPSDLTLVSNVRTAGESEAYRRWLAALKGACEQAGVVLIFDEVYTGFRLAPGGAQQYFDVQVRRRCGGRAGGGARHSLKRLRSGRQRRHLTPSLSRSAHARARQADMVVYGKTLGGGLPVGAVCGPHHLMARTDLASPLRVAYVIGTFAAHPVVMSTMGQFLTWVETDEAAALYTSVQARVDAWVGETNAALEGAELPLRVASYGTVWTILFLTPGRYHWMLQYYLRDEGVQLSWVGTGRLSFALDWEEGHFAELSRKLLAASARMRDDGWWWHDPRGNGLIQLQLASELICASAQHITLWWWKAVFSRMYRWSSMITRTI